MRLPHLLGVPLNHFTDFIHSSSHGQERVSLKSVNQTNMPEYLAGVDVWSPISIWRNLL